MIITIQRKYKKKDYTIGNMYIDGVFFCNTLEDTDRGLCSDMPITEIKRVKIYAKTAIPTGTYELDVVTWPKYKIKVPMILAVPGYSGILIHNGTNHEHTAGCPLVGINNVVGGLTRGKEYMNKLTEIVSKEIKLGKKVYITIE